MLYRECMVVSKAYFIWPARVFERIVRLIYLKKHVQKSINGLSLQIIIQRNIAEKADIPYWFHPLCPS